MRIIANIDVPALTPAIAFYCDALGLELSRIMDDDVAELMGGDMMLCLLVAPAGAKPAATVQEPRRYARHWTPVHLDFVVSDLEQSSARAVKAGARPEGAWREWRGSRCATFSDPFGHGFCLIEFDDHTYH
jgi:predicted enzyme related to lactoylglutathione lyase